MTWVFFFFKSLICVTLCSPEILEGVWSADLHVAPPGPLYVLGISDGSTMACYPSGVDFHLNIICQAVQEETCPKHLKLHSNLYVICNRSASTLYPVTAVNYQHFLSLSSSALEIYLYSLGCSITARALILDTAAIKVDCRTL